MPNIDYYTDKFSRLRMASQGDKKSPHKVCMLLAVMELVSVGYIKENRIELDGTLKERFSHFFNKLRQGNDRDTPELPFFHLKSEGFWHLLSRDGVDLSTVRRYSRSAISHAFVDDDLFVIFKSSILSNDLKVALTENLSDLPAMYSQYLLDIGKSEKTVFNYLQALQGSISNWVQENGITAEPLLEVKSYKTFTDITQQAKQLEVFQARDLKGKGMYSAALHSYQRFLSDLSQVDLKADLQQIWQDQSISETEKSVMASARMGQGTFRNQLINMWKGCAISGYKNTQMLIASHIKPWKDSSNQERLDKYNGLLLLANFDKAFDLGFISFMDSGQILISPQLEAPNVIGVDDNSSITLQHAHKGYLDFHRESRFRK